MKRILKLLVLGISILCLTISASALIAIEPLSTNTYTLSLTFSGTTATCGLTINGASGTTKIDNCTVTLTDDSNGAVVAEWTNLSATGARLFFSRNASPVVRGRIYTLSFSATIHRNGTTQPISGSITRTYN